MPAPGSTALWEALGLTKAELRVYRSLLHDPESTDEARAAATRVDAARATTILSRLVDLGLAHRRDGRVVPARPTGALLALSHARRAALEGVDTVASELEAVFAAGAAFSEPSKLFEVVRGGADILDRLRELVSLATVSIDSVDTPPYVAGPNPALHDAEAAAVRRGVRIRTLVDYSALDDEHHVRDVLRSVEEGQQVRLSSRVRTKMLVIDGTHVLIPLAIDLAYGEPHAAVIAHREIVDALAGYFDRLFEHAVPLDPVTGSPVSAGSGVLFSDQEERLLQLLSSGMTDGAIAGILGVSERTLRRRIGLLQDRLGAGVASSWGSWWSGRVWPPTPIASRPTERRAAASRMSSCTLLRIPWYRPRERSAMDTTQLLKGVLDAAVLAVVQHDDGYGYDIVRRLRDAGLGEVGDASVYGTLRRLYSGGALSSYVVPSEGGPHRKYYAINAQGRELLDAQRASWSQFSTAMTDLLQPRQTPPALRTIGEPR